MHSICHFEIPADDPQRAQKFYEGLFGWEFKHYPEMDYYGVMTGPDEEVVNGGMMKRQQPGQPIINYISVESVEASADKVKELGGQVVMGKSPVPEMGWFAVCLDSEGNVFALWEADKDAK